jgi:hypothetical protein
MEELLQAKWKDGNLPHIWFLAECACQKPVIVQEQVLHRHRPIYSSEKLGLQGGRIYRSTDLDRPDFAIWTINEMAFEIVTTATPICPWRAIAMSHSHAIAA